MTWAERVASDESLRAFVDAEVARAHVELAALKVEHERLQRLTTWQAKRISELEAVVGSRERQRALKGSAA